MVDFLFALNELFSLAYLLRFRNYEAKCVQLGCFHRGRPLCTQILPGQGRPQHHLHKNSVSFFLHKKNAEFLCKFSVLVQVLQVSVILIYFISFYCKWGN